MSRANEAKAVSVMGKFQMAGVAATRS
jgi:hypothetical protein